MDEIRPIGLIGRWDDWGLGHVGGLGMAGQIGPMSLTGRNKTYWTHWALGRQETSENGWRTGEPADLRVRLKYQIALIKVY